VESLEVKIRSMVSPGMMDETAQVLLATTDKRPVVSAKPVGRGEVVFVATGMDNRWGNWAEIGETGTLPMFVQVTVSHFVNRAGRGTNFALGQTIRWTPPEGGEYDLVRPDGSRSFVGKPGGGESKSYSLEARAAGEPGVYRFERVMAPDESGKTPPSDLVSPPFAVNPDTTESEQLTAASEGEIETAFGFMPTILSADGDLASERSRREWTVYLLIALFAVAVFEAYWAWRCGRVA
jgi:hypothetical protein